jgi:hypothetical protein
VFSPNVLHKAMQSPSKRPATGSTSVRSATSIQHSYNEYFVYGKGRLDALKALRGQPLEEFSSSADISQMLISEALAKEGASPSDMPDAVPTRRSTSRRPSLVGKGPTKLSRVQKLPPTLASQHTKGRVRSMESVVDDLFNKVKGAWDGDGLAPPTTQPEGALDALSRTAATLKALGVCVPRLDGVLQDIISRIEHTHRFVSVSSEDHFLAKARLREVETEYHDKVEEANYRCTREVQRLTADWEKKERDLDVLQRVCDGLKGRVGSVEKARKGASERLHGAELMNSKNRIEVTQLRSKLSEMERKSNELIAENRYLRTIADHNAKLLGEVERLEERVRDLRREAAPLSHM